jgi:hypothetical protein
MPRNVDEIISDIVRAVEVVQTENASYQQLLISHGHSSYVDDTKKKVDIVKEKNREIQNLNDEIKRMQADKDIFFKNVREEIEKRDKYIKDLASKVPKGESGSLGAKTRIESLSDKQMKKGDDIEFSLIKPRTWFGGGTDACLLRPAH